MPTYVYRCKACEHQFETFQKMTDEPLRECEECGGEVTRLLFPVGIVFKGSGFHINDYPSSGSGNGSKSTTTGSKPESAVDSKKETASSKAD